MDAIPDNIDLKIPFGIINVNSIGDRYIEINCITDNLEVKYIFNHFHGYENRSEFFDRKPDHKYIFKKLHGSNANFPISYVSYDSFKNDLSGYESVHTNLNTKLWIFLSLTNFIELYSSAEPIREIKILEKK